MHIRQAEVAALEAVGEALVVEAEEVQNRGLDVVNVERLPSAVVSGNRAPG